MFWDFPRLNPYTAASFDKLHANDIGNNGDHIWPEFQSAVEDMGRAAHAAIDIQ